MKKLLQTPREMDVNAPKLAATWKKWKQNMEFYLTAMMKRKTATKLCGCGGTNIPAVGKITVK